MERGSLSTTCGSRPGVVVRRARADNPADSQVMICGTWIAGLGGGARANT
jgi:hypothetical protein